MCEMKDSWPWAQAWLCGVCVCDTERLTVGCIGDMSGPGDRGLLTAGAHGHTHARLTTLIAPQKEKWGCLVVCITLDPSSIHKALGQRSKGPLQCCFVSACCNYIPQLMYQLWRQGGKLQGGASTRVTTVVCGTTPGLVTMTLLVKDSSIFVIYQTQCHTYAQNASLFGVCIKD